MIRCLTKGRSISLHGWNDFCFRFPSHLRYFDIQLFDSHMVWCNSGPFGKRGRYASAASLPNTMAPVLGFSPQGAGAYRDAEAKVHASVLSGTSCRSHGWYTEASPLLAPTSRPLSSTTNTLSLLDSCPDVSYLMFIPHSIHYSYYRSLHRPLPFFTASSS